MIWRGDHDRHAIVLDGRKKVLAHPLGEFLLVAVKQNDVVTAASVEGLGPGSHGASCPSAITSQLSWYAALSPCDGEQVDRHYDMQ